MKPNFFIVGTPKAGTTSLYHYLDEHPDIFMSPIKETNFFSYSDIKHQGLFYNEEHIATEEAYLKLFEEAGAAKAVGEASVSYLFYPSVPAKIKQFTSKAKIIVILRNPIDRGYSHFLMDKRLGFVKASYEDIVLKKNIDSLNKLFYQQYVELGLYHQQLNRYIKTFGSQSVKIFLYEELISDTSQMIKELYRFLEVDETFVPQLQKKHNTFSEPKNAFIAKLYQMKALRKLGKRLAGDGLHAVERLLLSHDKKPPMSNNLRNELIRIYTPDVLRVEQFVGKDLSRWLR